MTVFVLPWAMIKISEKRDRNSLRIIYNKNNIQKKEQKSFKIYWVVVKTVSSYDSSATKIPHEYLWKLQLALKTESEKQMIIFQTLVRERHPWCKSTVLLTGGIFLGGDNIIY